MLPCQQIWHKPLPSPPKKKNKQTFFFSFFNSFLLSLGFTSSTSETERKQNIWNILSRNIQFFIQFYFVPIALIFPILFAQSSPKSFLHFSTCQYLFSSQHTEQGEKLPTYMRYDWNVSGLVLFFCKKNCAWERLHIKHSNIFLLQFVLDSHKIWCKHTAPFIFFCYIHLENH